MTANHYTRAAHTAGSTRAAMFALSQQGMSNRAIGKVYGISGERVAQMLRKHGYKPRKSGKVIEGY